MPAWRYASVMLGSVAHQPADFGIGTTPKCCGDRVARCQMDELDTPAPRFLLAGECDPVRAGDRVRVYARRGPYVCIYPHDTVSPCKWTHEKALTK